ncbi:MAG: DUF6286 domain-containing protein [Acidimicrobiales bacterium]
MRVANRVLSAVLALALAVGGLLVAVEIVLGGLDRGPWILPYDRWERTAVDTPWSDGNIRLLSLALVVVGVLVLAVQVARRRPDALALAGSGQSTTSLDCKGVERWLAERVERVEGVAGAQVKVGRKAAVVRATAIGRDRAEVERKVGDAVRRHLEELALAQPLRADVGVASASGDR